jgi:hypothetical protein
MHGPYLLALRGTPIPIIFPIVWKLLLPGPDAVSWVDWMNLFSFNLVELGLHFSEKLRQISFLVEQILKKRVKNADNSSQKDKE